MAAVILGVAVAPWRDVPLAWLAGLVMAGLTAVALLEHWFPFDPRWRHPDRDFPADVIHAVINLVVMHSAVLGFVVLRNWVGWQGMWWPNDWPYLAQVFMAGLPLDLSLYLQQRDACVLDSKPTTGFLIRSNTGESPWRPA